MEKERKINSLIVGNLNDSLVALVRYFSQLKTLDSLTNGLPLTSDGLLSPDIFTRAALRAHLKATTHSVSLKEIKQHRGPLLMLLDDELSAVLVYHCKKGKLICHNFRSGRRKCIAMAELEKAYTGKIISIAPINWVQSFIERLADHKINSKMSWFWKEIFPFSAIYAEALVATLFINMLTLGSPLFVMNVYDRVVPNQAIETLWILAFAVMMAYLFDFVLRMMRTYFLDYAAKQIDTILSAKVFSKILEIRQESRPPTVGGLSNTVQAFETFRDFITSATITALIDFPFVIIFIGCIALIGGSLAWIPLALFPVVLVISLLIQIPLVRMVQKSYEVANSKQTTLIETILGITTIKKSNAQSNIQAKWEDIIDYSSSIGVKIRLLSALAVNFAIFAQYLASVIIVIAGVYKISANELTVGALIACTILSGRALSPIGQITSLLMRYYQSVAAIRGVSSLMELPSERRDDSHYLHCSEHRGEITFKGVSFAYPQAKVPALVEVSFTIRPGERVAVIGRMGSGKSTLEKLMLCLYQPTSGNVLFDGLDIHNFDPADIRHLIGYVPQDIVLFSGSVHENIVFGSTHVSDDQLLDAVRFANLDNLFANHPDGINMEIGERGDKLSGGQRQAIAVAQAVLHRPKIMIMDEPTSAMDEVTESYFKENLKQILPDKTLILITHKMSLLELVDRIIVLDHGRLVADGARDDVLAALSGKVKSPQSPPSDET